MEKAKKIKSIVASCLAGVCLATAGLAVATDGFKSFKKNDNIQMELPEENNGGAPVVDENGEQLPSGETIPMPTAMTFRSAAALDGKAAEYDSVTLTATVKPDNADNKTVDWSVSFVNPSSSWASGKTVTDYVTVTPTADGSTTATVQCLKDFGEQIKITVTSRDNADATASCTVDFAKRIENMTVNLSSDTSDNTASFDMDSTSVQFPFDFRSEQFKYSIDYTYSDFTVDDTFDVNFSVDVPIAVWNNQVCEAIPDISAYYPFPDTLLKEDNKVMPLWLAFRLGDEEGETMNSHSALFNSLVDWLKTNNSEKNFLFIFIVEAEGTYSDARASSRVLFTEDSLSISVTDVSLDDTNVII